ncbi:MAG TPA: tRNA lysidine(34) synthetase TilS [Burkholderiales bacterium]|nr:tRNA lysidine(34) synthetase TilS [Burkholderiales bacterium]
MASTRKPPSVDAAGLALRGRRVAVGLSGGVDSVVLLHLLRDAAPQLGFVLSAVHVHHGLSPNAGAWARFCRKLCRAWGVPLTVRRVRVRRAGQGLEAAAREARRAVFAGLPAEVVALAHQLDDQAETVLMNLLRGTGLRGASAMPAAGRLGRKILWRPLLAVPRRALLAHARAQRLQWVEDESNGDEALTRNFLRRRVGPLLEARFPRWRESLARAARHFASAEASAERALRAFLGAQGLRSPSAAKLVEMLRQLTGRGARTAIAHDGAVLRAYRGRVSVERPGAPAEEVRLRPARGRGIDAARLERGRVSLRLRAGGERLQLDPRRPRRTLKNLFQEAGVAPWQRERLPLLYCDDELVWVPQLGIAAGWHAPRGARGLVPEWRPAAA